MPPGSVTAKREKEAWLKAQTSKQLLKTALSLQLIVVSCCFKFPSYGSHLTKQHPREASRQRRFMRAHIWDSIWVTPSIASLNSNNMDTPLDQHEAQNVGHTGNSRKSGLSSNASSAAGWNFQTLNFGDDDGTDGWQKHSKLLPERNGRIFERNTHSSRHCSDVHHQIDVVKHCLYQADQWNVISAQCSNDGCCPRILITKTGWWIPAQ